MFRHFVGVEEGQLMIAYFPKTFEVDDVHKETALLWLNQIVPAKFNSIRIWTEMDGQEFHGYLATYTTYSHANLGMFNP